MFKFLNDNVRPWYAEVTPKRAVADTLLAGFGGVMAIRAFGEGRVYLLRWKSFTVGNSGGFTTYAYYAAKGLQYYEPRGRWYDKRWFAWGLTLAGLSVGVGQGVIANKTRNVSLAELFTASELFHMTVTYPTLTAAIIHSGVVLFFVADDVPTETKLKAAAALTLYCAALGYDFISPESGKPGR